MTFDAQAAERAWQNGKIVLVGAYEAYGKREPWVANVDSLLSGAFEANLVKLAAEFRAFGKPMFFSVGRELNGIGLDYFGGFGPNGDQPLKWALENQKGLAEFDPSGYPNAHLYADLGDPEVSDGVERLIAANPSYFHSCAYFSDGSQIPTCSTPTSVADEPSAIPTEFKLEQNYPNPFNPGTTIDYQLPESGNTTLSIFTLLGQEVRTLVNKNQAAGSYSVVWNGRDDLAREVASGIYFYRLKVNAAGKNILQTRKLLLMR